MENVLVIDFNNLMFRGLFAKDVCIRTEQPLWALWRYLVFDSIYEQLGHIRACEVILAVDDKNSWRKSFFPRYKETRKPKREKQKLPVGWNCVFDKVNEYLKDLRHHMPFRVMKVRSAEADDIIAVLARELTYHDKEIKCIISSNDEDYLQLSAERIKIWNPSKRKYVTHVKSPARFLLEKILMGQAKDDIFNVRTPNNWPVGKRKPSMGKVMTKKILDGRPKDVKNWLTIHNYEKNFRRNRILIDFNYIPKTIEQRILETYDQYNFPPPRNIMPFFKKHSMRGYQEDFHRVEERLMRLY